MTREEFLKRVADLCIEYENVSENQETLGCYITTSDPEFEDNEDNLYEFNGLEMAEIPNFNVCKMPNNCLVTIKES